MLSQGLSDQLINRGLLDAAQISAAQQAARAHDLPFATWLIRQQLVDSSLLSQLISASCHTAMLDLDAVALETCPRTALDEQLARRFQVLPLHSDGQHLLLAFADPAALRIVDELPNPPGTVEFLVTDHIRLAAILNEWLSGHTRNQDEATAELLVVEPGHCDPAPEQTDGLSLAMENGESDEAPVVRFVNQVILDAVRRQVSDIHFETGEEHFRIRYRVDGVLQSASQLAAHMAPRINARLKVMAGLDISERRRPQDGRLRVRLRGNHTVDLRLNSVPTLWGEKLVLRVLDASALHRPIAELGFEPSQSALYLSALHRAQGLILVAGPTGSGKSVSLYSGLQQLNDGQRNISTVEDPVEIYLEGINQVAVNTRTGMGFASALRAFLRQDPDVIMVGEIRDQETADIAIKAAQTGHLVLSTLHTNSAVETIMRLADMGIPRYSLTSALSLIIAQRLLRRLCDFCKVPVPVDPEQCRSLGMTDELISTAALFSAGTCSRCRQGYRGRVAIMEVLPVTDALRQQMQHGTVEDITAAALAAGMQPMRQVALARAARGQICLHDVARVC